MLDSRGLTLHKTLRHILVSTSGITVAGFGSDRSPCAQASLSQGHSRVNCSHPHNVSDASGITVSPCVLHAHGNERLGCGAYSLASGVSIFLDLLPCA